MKKIEYDSLYIERGVNDSKLIMTLNELGQDGWDLISEDRGRYKSKCLLKRETEERLNFKESEEFQKGITSPFTVGD